MKILLIVITLTILGLSNDSALSQEEVELSLDITSRLKNDNEQLKLQSFIRLKLQVTIEEGVELIGIGATGPSFNNKYLTLYNSESGTPSDTEFYLPQLYLQYNSENFGIALGALEMRKDTEAIITPLYSSGFIDGGRVSIGRDEADWKATATLGSINDVTVAQPNFFQRSLDLGNYVETVFHLKPWEDAKLELGYEKINGENYYHGILSHEFEQILNRSLKVILENIYNQESASFHSGLTVNLALTDEFSPPQVTYNWIHQEMEYINFRWMNMIDDGLIARPGTSSIMTFTFPVKGMKLYVRWRHHHDNPKWHRYGVGISWRGRIRNRRLK